MHLLSLENVSKQWDDRVLFRDVSWGIQHGERVGVIGTNGSGKSTLLQLVAGVAQPDTGRVTVNREARVMYLPQNPPMDDQATVLEHVFSTNSPRLALVRRYEQAVEAVRQRPDDAAAMTSLGELSAQMDVNDGWETERYAKTALSHLGITDLGARLGTLSGGQRRRVALAAALIDPADLLILDEPTNHLDAETVEWLEGELLRTPAALLLVTHDRYFLDRVVKRVLALENGGVWESEGGYRDYLRRKAERVETQDAQSRRRASIMRVELAWMQQGAKARSTKQQARIQRFEALKDAPQLQAERELTMTVPLAQRLGKRVFELKHVGKRWGERVLWRDLTLSIGPGERLGIVGPNATGKTTLLNLLAERTVADEGELVRGETVRLGYYDQESADLRPDLRVIEYLESEAPLITTNEGLPITAGQMLERFLFDPKAQYSHIRTLSGGERRRLYLLRTLLFAPNVLLLDEPTNDLDVETLAVLEDYLDGWPGTLIVASHDRYFLDRTVDHLLVFEDGKIRTFPGSYTAYAEARSAQRAAMLGVAKAAPKAAPAAPAQAAPAKARKLSFKEQREWGELEGRIAALEARQATLNTLLSNGTGDYKQIETWAHELGEATTALEAALERWIELGELAEA